MIFCCCCSALKIKDFESERIFFCEWQWKNFSANTMNDCSCPNWLIVHCINRAVGEVERSHRWNECFRWQVELRFRVGLFLPSTWHTWVPWSWKSCPMEVRSCFVESLIAFPVLWKHFFTILVSSKNMPIKAIKENTIYYRWFIFFLTNSIMTYNKILFRTIHSRNLSSKHRNYIQADPKI